MKKALSPVSASPDVKKPYQTVKKNRDRPLNLPSCLKGVENGLDHLHKLDLNHSDINPTNIMLDNEDVPIIIDFDSRQREDALSFGTGTPGWTDNSITGIPERKNNEFGLIQLYKTFLKDLPLSFDFTTIYPHMLRKYPTSDFVFVPNTLTSFNSCSSNLPETNHQFLTPAPKLPPR